MTHKHKWRPADSEQIVPGWPRCSICNVPASSVGEAFKGLCEEVALLEDVANKAYQWSAGYPLGGGMDDIAAKDIYQRCITLYKLENPDANT